MNGGVFICSRAPIKRQLTRVFTHGSGADRLVAKGFVYVETTFNGYLIGIIGTHLQAYPGDHEKGIRSAQLDQIRAFIDSETGDADVVIVAGDMNMDFQSDEYHDMIETLNASDPNVVQTAAGTTWKSYDPETLAKERGVASKWPSQHLDYILAIRPPTFDNLQHRPLVEIRNTTVRMRSSVDPTVDLSDHSAIVGTITLTSELTTE